jgi:hypothetical protein
MTGRGPAMRSRATCSSQRRQYIAAMFRSVRRPDIVLGMLLLVPVAAQADFYDQPFATRLLFAVDRQSNYSSTLARQASIAALEGGSANPGAAAWREPPEPTTTVTTSFVYAPSGGGREVIAAPVSLRWQAPGHGTVALAYAFTDTRNAGGENGLTQSLRSDEWIGGYGRRVDEHAAVGFTVRLTSGTIVGDSRTAASGDQPIRASTRFLAPDMSMGYAAEISSAATVGITAGYGRARADTSVMNLAPLMVSLPPAGIPVTIPSGALLEQSHEVISTYSIRGGAGLHLDNGTAIYLDATGLRLSTRYAGSQTLGRFAVGAERAVGRGWILRSGAGIDTIGKVNVSAGFGYRASRSFEAQFAFQSNAAPEVNPEIGRTRLVSGSLAWIF